MVATALLVAGFGLSAWALLRAAIPPAPALDEALAALRPRAGAASARGVAQDSWRETWGRQLLAFLERRGWSLAARRADLRVLGRAPERHVIEKALAAGALAGLPVAAGFALTVGGLMLSPVLEGVAFLVLGVVGFVVPDLTLHSEAERRRRQFRFALAHYLESAVVVLAAGSGVETALYHAAEAGEGWVYQELRRALRGASLAGTSPWDALGELAEDLDVPQLAEVAAVMELAGEHGAKVRTALSDHAAGMRADQLTEVREKANIATETMSVPVVGLLFAFLGFVAFPALARIFVSL